jgi:uncharacterized membrane protein YkoI
MKILIGSALLMGALVAAPLASRADVRPSESKPLAQIVSALEEQGFTPIVEVSFDDGVWEVEAFREDQALELSVDPVSGKVISEHRDDADAKPAAEALALSKIIAAVADAGYADITEASFEGRSWEIEATRENQKRELRVDLNDGSVISDRVDD